MSETVLQLRGVRKSYNLGLSNEVEVLHGIDLCLQRSDFCALVGPSGSGKSSLLNLIAQLDVPTAGEIELLGQPTHGLSDSARSRLRRQALSMVFQFHHLLPAFTALENVLLPLMIDQGRPSTQARAQAYDLLAAVGLADWAQRRVTELSGGQQQRVAIARALITRPPLLVADEPTGNLDTHSAQGVFDLFRQFHHSEGCAIVLVTHDPRLAQQAGRCITLVDGRIASDERLRACS